MGGEKCYIGESKSNETGSPPRGRGKGKLVRYMDDVTRITPAWAGKSPPAGGLLSGPQDHPRVGGEKRLAFPCLRL